MSSDPNTPSTFECLNTSKTHRILELPYVPPTSLQPITLNYPPTASITATAYAFLCLKITDLFPKDDKTRIIVNLL